MVKKSETNLNSTQPVMKVKHLLQLDVLIQGNALLMNQPASCPALERLLGYADPGSTVVATPATWLLQAFGVPRQHDMPAAVYSALGDQLPATTGYWLRADPVYLHLLRDRIVLPQPVVEDVSVAEAQAMVATLNQHFADLRFYAPHPQRWYVRVAQPPSLVTCEPLAAVGYDIRQHMPQGGDGKAWINLLNEIQMLLHQHPVNQQREDEGKFPINGLWAWGGGVLAGAGVVQPSPYDQLWGDDPLLAGLAAGQTRQQPQNLQVCLDHPAQRQLLMLEAGLDWAALEQRWFAPMFQALKSKKAGKIRLLFAKGATLHVFSIQRSSLWKFWRSGKKPGEVMGVGSVG